ncbi:MAG: ABC transporter ATP-binding protein [Candidatus Hydrogenedentota bacterium]
MQTTTTLLSVNDLHAHFHTREGVVCAVNGVSFSLAKGETLGLVGESGSGKSVLNYALLGLLPAPPARITGGGAHFDGVDLLRCPQRTLRHIRGNRITMIFQDPMTALNPFMPVGRQIMEALRTHTGASRRTARDRALAMLEAVGIQDAAARINDFPHAFSGGMRQRVMIAMALITRPQLLIADEPTTALDVTVQAQILDLIGSLQDEMGMAVIFVTHDLGVIAGLCSRVLVMYAGRILESGPAGAVFHHPRHPYTAGLLASLPAANAPGADLHVIPGLPPDPVQRPAGCPFAPRCPHVASQCRTSPCPLHAIGPGHHTACVRALEGSL